VQQDTDRLMSKKVNCCPVGICRRQASKRVLRTLACSSSRCDAMEWRMYRGHDMQHVVQSSWCRWDTHNRMQCCDQHLGSTVGQLQRAR
jgi:hypothetical protein